MVQVAVVGVGGWGKNLARTYFQIPECSLKYICDLDQQKLEQLRLHCPAPGSPAVSKTFETLSCRRSSSRPRLRLTTRCARRSASGQGRSC
jgi:predicted dehydrogenase